MPEDQTPFVKLRAITLTTCLLLAAVTGSLMTPVAGQGASAQSDYPTLTAGNASASPGNTATLNVNYDVSSEGVDAESLVVTAYELKRESTQGTMTAVGNTDTLTELSGTVPVDVDVSDTPGDYRVWVQLTDDGGDSIVSDTGYVDVDSPVSVTDFTAPGVANVGDPIDVSVGVENTGTQQDVRLQAYVDDSPFATDFDTYEIGSDSSTKSLPVTFDSNTFVGPHELTINGQTAQTVIVSDPEVAFSDLSVSSEDHSVTATATVKNTANSDEQDIDVPLYVDGMMVDETTVTLDSDASTDVSLSAFVLGGEHEVGIGDLTPESVTVEAGGGSGDGPGDGDGSNDYEDETPGYDVIKGEGVESTGVGNAPSEEPTLRVSEPKGNTLMDAEVLVPLDGDGPADPYDLAEIGADSSTQFELDLKIHEDHEPMLLLGTAQNVAWTKEKISGEDYYQVTVYANPTEAQYVGDPPRQWGTDEGSYYTAEFDYDAMLDISFVTSDALSNANLDGATIATDAQSVGMPSYDPEAKALGLYVGGPHYATGGSVNTGEYEAFLPDALLDDWGVDDPAADLQGNFDDQQYDSTTDGFEVTDEGVSGGVLVEFPIHYSEGTVSVSPADGAPDESTSSTGSPSWNYPDYSRDASTTTGPTTTTSPTATTEPTTTTPPSETTAASSPGTATQTPETTETESSTETELAMETETITATAAGSGGSTTGESTNDGGVPGFGTAATVIALLAAALVALRRSD